MKPLTFTEADIHGGSLILVNAAHPLAEAAPVRCVPVSPGGGGGDAGSVGSGGTAAYFYADRLWYAHPAG